ncbi:hypothetical protein [Aestuariirhabdus litorea]|uniref:SCP2 domain-containing protein n=1 Tax=Aestuariirhabdus litorea TaxID=2528527 RepID=A0A3P3VJA4_9GAMM|nr:hypothetical protein [Aestuariirhabdus litorea]RRJ82831.1 hypothetical protein D0544_13350 [Aestuariirhabdus litorea]RWW92990.1 hypothetical protein DZC74_13325 [Endozoicomonadaceae bacterium GTF-13]
MKYRLLLWLISLAYRRAVRRNAAMREYLDGVQKTIQFTSDQPVVSRYLRFESQALASAAGLTEADMTIRFVTPAEGFSILWAMARGRDKNAFMRAIQEQTVRVEGDPMLLLWFQKSMKYL